MSVTSAESALYLILSAVSGGRVYPLVLPDNVAVPAIVYQRISTRPINVLDGTLPYEEIRWQIDAWAMTAPAAMSAFIEARQALLQQPHYFMLDGYSTEYEPDTKRYRVTADVIGWYNPSQ